jgi:hypothetical protein
MPMEAAKMAVAAPMQATTASAKGRAVEEDVGSARSCRRRR